MTKIVISIVVLHNIIELEDILEDIECILLHKPNKQRLDQRADLKCPICNEKLVSIISN